MTLTWRRLGPVAAGGTALGISATEDARMWLASSAGLFRSSDGTNWRPLAHGRPIPQINALAADGTTLLAGGYGGQIVYSTDAGESWFRSRISQTEASITSLVTSPDFSNDGVALAGTDGDGILRSTDRGRSWRLVNAGLHDFTILALAAAPQWVRREVVFAGTTRGLYRSPNGGRAWKRAESAAGDAVILSLAISPGFAVDKLALAGTEGHGVLRSTDGGHTWRPSNAGLGGDDAIPAINALWLSARADDYQIAVAGTGDGHLFRSLDGGSSWTRVAAALAPLLCVAEMANTLLAGQLDAGLLVSGDKGLTWAAVEGLAARALNRLAIGPAGEIIAFGTGEGGWQLGAGQRWQALDIGADLLALAFLPDPHRAFLAGTPAGVRWFEGTGPTRTENPAQPQGLADHIVSAVAAASGWAWAGTSTGRLFRSSLDAPEWKSVPGPPDSGAVIALAASRSDDTVAVAMRSATARSQVSIWGSPDGGATWHRWLQDVAHPPTAQVCLDGRQPVASIGERCWQRSQEGWKEVLHAGLPVLRLLAEPDGVTIAATAARIWMWTEDNRKVLSHNLPAAALVDVAFSPSASGGHVLIAMEVGGVLWRSEQTLSEA